MLPAFLLVLACQATELEASYDEVLEPDEKPELRVQLLQYQAALWVECQVGGQRLSWEFADVPPKSVRTVTLPDSPDITKASCQVLARFANGYTEGVDVEMAWRHAGLERKGDARKASVDLVSRVALLVASFEVHSARVRALDADGGTVFDEIVELRPRSGQVTVRWRSPGAENARKLHITLEGAGGEKLTYDLELRVSQQR